MMVMPVLAVLWLGVRYLDDRQHASALARLEARRCAWLHALGGCDQPPEGCRPESLEQQENEAQGAPDIAASALAETGPLDNDPFTSIPVLGRALEAIFGTTTHATIEREVRSPFTREPVHVSSRFVVLCNEQARSVVDVARAAFCDSTGLCR